MLAGLDAPWIFNGKVERSQRIDAEEFYRPLNGVVIDDADIFNEKLQERKHFYNFARPPAPGGLDLMDRCWMRHW